MTTDDNAMAAGLPFPEPDDQPARPVEDRESLPIDPVGLRVAGNVRAARRHKDWSMADLCRELANTDHSLSKDALLRIEQHKRRVSVGEVWALSEALGVSLPVLWGGEMAEQSGRPVEDREPVGPYAPTRATPLPDSVQEAIRRQQADRAAAAHVERMAKIRADGDAIRKEARAQGYADGIAHHARIVAAQTEARQLDGVWATDNSTVTPLLPYDVAERALDYATRLVKPIDAVRLPEDVASDVKVTAEAAQAIADRFYGWLWQFTDMTEGHPNPLDTCGSCSQPRERHDPGCLYAPRERTGDPWEGATSISLPKAEAFARGENWPEPSEEHQACLECLAGKHDNCGGRILDETSVNEPGPLKYLPCPCAGETHPESLG